MLRALALGLTDLEKEFKLLRSVVILLLLDTAVDHAIQWLQICLILLRSTLVSLVSLLVLSFQAALVASLCLIARVLWLKHDCHIQELQSAGEHLGLTTAEAREEARYIEYQI